jgi:hypothetical protein
VVKDCKGAHPEGFAPVCQFGTACRDHEACERRHYKKVMRLCMNGTACPEFSGARARAAGGVVERCSCCFVHPGEYIWTLTHAQPCMFGAACKFEATCPFQHPDADAKEKVALRELKTELAELEPTSLTALLGMDAWPVAKRELFQRAAQQYRANALVSIGDLRRAFCEASPELLILFLDMSGKLDAALAARE